MRILKVCADARYTNDAEIFNPDTSKFEEDTNAKMPCLKGTNWCPEVDVDRGVIMKPLFTTRFATASLRNSLLTARALSNHTKDMYLTACALRTRDMATTSTCMLIPTVQSIIGKCLSSNVFCLAGSKHNVA